AELDAYYARLYGLSRDELRYILDPADIYGPEFPGETFRVLKEKEIKQYGEYRTQRLVLAAWDAQEAAIKRGELEIGSREVGIREIGSKEKPPTGYSPHPTPSDREMGNREVGIREKAPTGYSPLPTPSD